MIPISLAVVVMVLAICVVGLMAFTWAWRRGHFRHLDEQARALFEPRDLLLERPWETRAQRDERRRRYGELERPARGEWGGSG